MRIVVTGASGFVGRHLSRKLAQSGIRVLALSRRPEHCENHPYIEKRACLDLERSDLASMLVGADVVVHLAAAAHERVQILEKARDYASIQRANAALSEAMAVQAARAGIRHFVFLSTIGVCGEETGPAAFTEETALAPRSLYARSKAEAEERLNRLAGGLALRLTVLRPTLVYGPGNGGNFLNMLRLVASGWPLPFASVQNRRSLIYVGNLVSAIEAVAVSRTISGTFIASDARPHSTPELIRMLASGMGRQPALFPMPVPILRFAARLAGREALARRLLGSLEADGGKLRRTLSWSPPFSEEDGLRATAAWFAERGTLAAA